VSTIEELLGRESSNSGIENSKLRSWGFVALTMQHSISAIVGTNFAENGRSLADSGHGVVARSIAGRGDWQTEPIFILVISNNYDN
jgi:hypothetical protein